VELALNDRFEAVRKPGETLEDTINQEMDEGTFDSASLKTCMKRALEINSNLLADLTHEAANILHSNENGGWAGRLSELRRITAELIEQIEGRP
jgi:hypothetical protein